MKRGLTIGLFLIFVLIINFSGVVHSQTILEARSAPEIIPLYNTDCPVNEDIYGDAGREALDVIYSFDSCYKNFLNRGWDESICGKFSEEEKTWSTILDYKTNACFLGFAIAKEDYKVCNGIKQQANYQNVYIDLPTCYTYTAVISRDITSCTLLNGKDKTDCFHFFGPSINLTWIIWFLPKVIFYILISLILFSTGSFFINIRYKKRLVIFSIILTVLQFLLFLIFSLRDGFTTDVLNLIILVPFIFLFLSTFVIQGYNFFIKRINRKWIFSMFSLLVGFIHGFLTAFISFFIVYSKYGIGLEIIGIFVFSLISGGILAIAYLILYLWLLSKLRNA